MTYLSNHDYVTPVIPEQAAKKCMCPPSLVRLAVDCGLPSLNGKIAPLDFAEWIIDNYNLVRQKAGLPLLEEPAESMTFEEKELLRTRNTLRTYADYFASRTTSLPLKEKVMQASNMLANCGAEDL
jgi:hypothetical protein